ncbi:MAG: DUF6129 family protein [Gammaproteobacteria bacterium]
MITEETLTQIADKITHTGIDESILSQLREEYPDMHFTYCSDDDIPNDNPLVERDGFNLYLVDGREHCLCLTNDLEHATGVVVAEIYGN